jgi:hypothetical protein
MEDMATSNGFTVPTRNFLVEDIPTTTGRRALSVTYRVRDGAVWRSVTTIYLRAQAAGTIELDVGGRGAAGRSRIGTHDFQAALDRACVVLQSIVADLDHGEQVQRTPQSSTTEEPVRILDAELEHRELSALCCRTGLLGEPTSGARNGSAAAALVSAPKLSFAELNRHAPACELLRRGIVSRHYQLCVS